MNVEASNLVVNAPEKSPNTDGIHVTRTENIQISHCNIGTGKSLFNENQVTFLLQIQLQFSHINFVG